MTDSGTDLELGPHEDEPHERGFNDRLSWLRAGVLGANDGIVSTAGIVLGVAGATTDRDIILVAGIAGLVAGAISMAAGEYVSVSTQRDSEKSILHLEATELQQMPQTEERELAKMYVDKGLSPATAEQVARELTQHDALRAHADIEFGIDPDNLTNPWQAACHGLVRLSGSMPNSMSACARSASCSVSSRATFSAVSGDRPFSTYIAASSRSSVCGI